MKKIINQKNLSYFIILIVAICMCIPLFQNGLYSSHDGDFHISRAFGTIEQITNGESPLVISRYSNGLGFGWNLFYPPVSTLFNVIFGFITNDIILSMKLFIFCTFVLSGITMYKMVNTITQNFKNYKISNIAALLASILYMVAPYRLLNTYTRLAVGEMVSFIFIPIIFRGVYYILNGQIKKSYLYVLGTIGLVLSHNISTMLIFILGFFYVLINIKKLKDSKILKTLIISTCIIILSVIFFEVPLLEQKSAVDYEVFRYGKMYSSTSVYGHALNPLQLIMRNAEGADSSMYFCIGVPIILAMLTTPFIIKKVKDSNKKDYKFYLITGCIATVMSTFIFPWFLMPDILLMVQFPWRMLVLVVFCFSIIGGINLAILLENIIEKIRYSKANLLKYSTTGLIIIFSILYSFSFISNVETNDINNEHYKEKEIIDTKNHVSRYSSFLEYWPQKAIDSIDYIVNHDNKVHTLSGSANITDEIKDKGNLSFYINNVNDNTFVELPFLFYKGYTVEYKSNNETKLIDVQESEHGLVGFNASKEMNGTINVKYQATLLHKICMVISFITMISYLIYLIVSNLKNKKDKEEIKKLKEAPDTSIEEKEKITL